MSISFLNAMFPIASGGGVCCYFATRSYLRQVPEGALLGTRLCVLMKHAYQEFGNGTKTYLEYRESLPADLLLSRPVLLPRCRAKGRMSFIVCFLFRSHIMEN